MKSNMISIHYSTYGAFNKLDKSCGIHPVLTNEYC